MRLMMRGMPVGGYEIIKADNKEVYRDAFFSMKLVEVYRSPVLHGYVIEVENLAEFPVLLRVQEIDFAGMIAISTGDEFLQPRPRKASEAVQEPFRDDKSGREHFPLTQIDGVARAKGGIDGVG